MSANSEKIAAALLETGAVKLNPDHPFVWASGRFSPVYCDNRVLLSFPEARQAVRDAFAALVRAEFPEAEAVAGVATAGIAHGVLLAEALGLPFAYVRPKPKEHGMKNQIEGRILPGAKTLVVEDLVSTGGSSLKAAEALAEAGAKNLAMLSVFTYGLPEADRNFAEAGIVLRSLTTYDILVQVAENKGIIEPSRLAILKKWREDPAAWSADFAKK